MRQLIRYLRMVDNLNNRIGNIVSMAIVAMISILALEVVLRYVFDSPTIWAHETAEFFYGAHFILGGAYALRWGSHVNVEILHDRLPIRMRAAIDLVTWMLFYVFIGLLLWQGGIAAWNGVARMEHSQTMWGPPIWPIKLTVPLAAALMLLQGFNKTIHDVYAAVNGREMTSAVTKVERL